MTRTLPIGTLLTLVMLFWTQTGSAQIYRLPSPDSLNGSFFGSSVAINADRIVVGADGDDACGVNAGAAHVFVRAANEDWTLETSIRAGDCADGHFFGRSVAIDGDRLAVASYRTSADGSSSNAVYIYDLIDGQWGLSARLRSPNEDESGPFASSIALDGDRLLVTSAGDAGTGRGVNGKGFVYERDQRASWTLAGTLQSPLPVSAGVLGTASALDGNRAVIAGSTYSREEPGIAIVFERSESGEWSSAAVLRGLDDFFISLDLDQDRMLIGESRGGTQGSGRARVLQYDGSTWKEEATLRPKTPYARGAFGSRVSLDGAFALVSGYDEQLELDINVDQVVYVFELKDGKWKQRRVLDVGESAFGSAIDANSGLAIVGQAVDGAPGQAYVVQLNR